MKNLFLFLTLNMLALYANSQCPTTLTASSTNITVGSAITLTAGGGSSSGYNWYPGADPNYTGSTLVVAPFNNNTTYSVSAIGCNDTAYVTINVVPFTASNACIKYVFKNFVQTSSSTFRYDVFATNCGVSPYKLRGYSFGLNLANGIAGTASNDILTHTFISRDPNLSALPLPNGVWTASTNHLRSTTLNTTISSNEVEMLPLVTFKLATMEVKRFIANVPASFPPNFSPFSASPLQVLTQPGKTQCVAGVRLNYANGPGALYSLYGIANNLTAHSLDVLEACIDSASTGFVLGCTETRLKCFIQCYWDGSTAMNPALYNQGESLDPNHCDTIEVELREDVAGYPIVGSQKVLLLIDGTTSPINFPNSVLDKSCYINVKHRNALMTCSKNPVHFNGSCIDYDFTDAITKAYGDNQIEVAPGKYAFYSGDINHDENIDLVDDQILNADIVEFVFGYEYDPLNVPLNTNYPGVINTDLDGTANSDIIDTACYELNISNFIFSQHPW